MPAGAFKLVWDSLLAGSPTCAYVTNLASDGSAYRAFATIMPVAGGYLSVRSRPCHAESIAALDELYATVREHELASRADGASAALVAAEGAAMIEDALAAIGFGSWNEWALNMLPLEVDVRSQHVAGLPLGHRQHFADALSAASDIEQLLSKISTELETFQQRAQLLDERLGQASRIVKTLDSELVSATSVATSLADRVPLLENATPALRAQCTRLGESLGRLDEQVHALSLNRAQLRFRVAMSRLQSELVGRYVLAVDAGEEDKRQAGTAARLLTTALELSLGTLSTDLKHNVEMAAAMSSEINDARGAFKRSQQLVTNWRGIIDRNSVAHYFDQLPALDAALDAAGPALDSLDEAASGFTVSADLNSYDLMAGLSRIKRAAQSL